MTSELKHKFSLTEKTALIREDNKIAVITKKEITKKEISSFISQKYEAEVVKVNSTIVKGKRKFRKRKYVKLPDRKKFYITVKDIKKFDN